MAVLLAGSAAFAQQPEPAAERRSVRAVRIDDGRIQVDGQLNEAAWAQAPSSGEFVQQQPAEGAAPTERSDVRFAYDSENLYVGARFYDSEPDRLIVNELANDFSPRDGDAFMLVIDTFGDLNSYSFQTNPMGAVRDTQNYDNGRTLNDVWDALWTIRTSMTADGWIAELAIPFRGLRFPESDDQVWGLQMTRVIRRKNEVLMWNPVPRQFNQFRMSYAGELHGLSGVRPGANIRIKPFAIGSTSSRLGVTDHDGDGGVDVKMGIGDGLVLDATYRTDFSQVEADAQQVNLTRFSLFFPEQREFFLENQGAFQIGRPVQGSNDLLPFFSRSIGLVNGAPVPIVGGGRLSGRIGRNELGLLNIGTEDENFSVVRYGRRIGGASTANVFYLGREHGAHFNRIAGADVRLNLSPAFDVDALLMRSDTAGIGDDAAYRFGATYDERRFRVAANHTSLGADFRDELGFVPRLGVDITRLEGFPRFRPDSRLVREWRPELAYARYDRPGFGVETETLEPGLGIDFQDGSSVTAVVRANEEAIDAPFRIRPGIAIAAGRYEFVDGEASVSTSRARPVSLTGGVRLGDFWDGTRRGFSAGARVRVNAYLAASLNVSRDAVTLPAGRFTTDLVQLRADASFSTRMFLNAFIQYNSQTRETVSNVRFNFVHHALSDLYVVYNETRPAAGGLPPGRALIVKLTHMLSF